MKKKVFIVLCFLGIFVSNAMAFDLWNGFTTEMTLNQVIARARSLRPSAEFLVNPPGMSVLEVYGGDKRDLNRQFQRTELSISYKFTINSLIQQGPHNVTFYFFRDKLYAVRLIMAINGAKLLSQTQKEYGNYKEAVDAIEISDLRDINPSFYSKKTWRIYSWTLPEKQVFASYIVDGDEWSHLIIVSK
jgi:hypothetical protein